MASSSLATRGQINMKVATFGGFTLFASKDKAESAIQKVISKTNTKSSELWVTS